MSYAELQKVQDRFSDLKDVAQNAPTIDQIRREREEGSTSVANIRTALDARISSLEGATRAITAGGKSLSGIPAPKRHRLDEGKSIERIAVITGNECHVENNEWYYDLGIAIEQARTGATTILKWAQASPNPIDDLAVAGRPDSVILERPNRDVFSALKSKMRRREHVEDRVETSIPKTALKPGAPCARTSAPRNSTNWIWNTSGCRSQCMSPSFPNSR